MQEKKNERVNQKVEISGVSSAYPKEPIGNIWKGNQLNLCSVEGKEPRDFSTPSSVECMSRSGSRSMGW